MQIQTETSTAPGTAYDERAAMIDALRAFIHQRPGFEPENYYGAPEAYRSDYGIARKHLQHARELLSAVEYSGITADVLRGAFRGAFSGRLSWEPERRALSYCTGQYFPTEYRAAACDVLASALWAYTRDRCMPAPSAWAREYRAAPDRYATEYYPTADAARAAADVDTRTLSVHALYGARKERAGDWLRRHFRERFGRAIARAWFN